MKYSFLIYTAVYINRVYSLPTCKVARQVVDIQKVSFAVFVNILAVFEFGHNIIDLFILRYGSGSLFCRDSGYGEKTTEQTDCH